MSGDAPLRVYGIGSCDTCRRARRYLGDHGIPHVFHDVREDGLTIQMLERWAKRAGWQKLLNRQSLTWRRIPEADRGEITHDRALALILEHPTLLKRPVLEHPGYIAVGFSEARFADFLGRAASGPR